MGSGAGIACGRGAHEVWWNCQMSVAAVYCHYAKEDVMNASTLISFCQDAIHIVVMPAFVAAIVCKAVVYISFFLIPAACARVSSV